MPSNLFYIKVIEQYKRNPCLWDFNDPEYKDKFVRHEAWKKLLEAAQSVYPDYTISRLVTKIANMRGVYRKQLLKIKKAQEAGEVYEPQLFYFNLLSFLRPHYNEKYSMDDQRASENEEESGYINDQESPTVLEDTTNENYQGSSNSTNTSLMPTDNSNEPEWSQLLDDFTKVKEQVNEICVLEEKDKDLENSIHTSPTPKKRYYKQVSKLTQLLDNFKEIKQLTDKTCVSGETTSLPQMSSACFTKNRLDSSCSSSTSRENPKRARTEVPPPSEANEILEKLSKFIENSSEMTVHKDKERTYDSFGDYVAGKLRYMPSEMVPMCQKLINDAIFYGETKNLNMTSRIATDH